MSKRVELPKAGAGWTRIVVHKPGGNGFEEPSPQQIDEIARRCNVFPELVEALEDMLAGWRYIREVHGDLYGVGWDRAEDKAREALEKARGEQ